MKDNIRRNPDFPRYFQALNGQVHMATGSDNCLFRLGNRKNQGIRCVAFFLGETGWLLDLNQRKEDFSKSYLCAIAAKCGWTVGTWTQDQFKIDSSLSKLVQHPDETEEVLHIDFQLKCTERPTADNANFVSFTLRDKDFEVLSKRRGGKPMFLCVVVVPDDSEKWFELINADGGEFHKSTRLRHCGYLAFISDEEGNYLQDDRTIRFLKGHHVFDTGSLDQIERKLMDPAYRIKALNADRERWEKRKDAEHV